MLVVVDAGNTNVTIGVFEQKELIAHWRLRTVHEQTVDEWGILLRNLFALSSVDLKCVDGMIIGSVVPPRAPRLRRTTDALRKYSARLAKKVLGCPAFVLPPTDR
jgi:type III pantothenate kinase